MAQSRDKETLKKKVDESSLRSGCGSEKASLDRWSRADIWPLQLAVDFVCGEIVSGELLGGLIDYETVDVEDRVDRWHHAAPEIQEAIAHEGNSARTRELYAHAKLIFASQKSAHEYKKTGMLALVTIEVSTGGAAIFWVRPKAFVKWAQKQGVEVPAYVVEMLDMSRRPNRRRDAAPDFLFRREAGGSWTISYEGEVVPILADLEGFRCIAYLLERPNEDVPVETLCLSIDGHDAETPPLEEHIDASSDTQPVLSAETIEKLKEKLEFLEVEEARASNNPRQLENICKEKTEIEEYLRKHLDIHGRPRHFPSTHERARKRILGNITRARRRLDKDFPVLAAHLRRYLRTGGTCSYSGDVFWRVQIA